MRNEDYESLSLTSLRVKPVCPGKVIEILIMARYASEAEVRDVRELIQLITHFSPSDENFKRCVSFALSTLHNHNFLDPHSGDVEKEMEGMIEKLNIHAHFKRAQLLREAYERLKASEDFTKEEREAMWKVLHFLVLLSDAPASDQPIVIHRSLSVTKSNEEQIDWASYLLEGVDIDPAIGQESSDESEWSSCDADGGSDDHVSESSLEIGAADSLEEKSVAINYNEGNQNLKEDSLTSEAIALQEEWLSSINESWKAIVPGFQFTNKQPSAFPAANLLKSWASWTGTDISHVRILHEYMIIRELLMALRDPRACGLVFTREDGHKFTVTSDLAVCSLTPGSLQAALAKYCPVLSALSQMQAFIKQMIPTAGGEDCLPPATYKAYACVLHIILKKQFKYLLDLEREVMKQDKVFTVLSMESHLAEWVQFQMDLFSVHKKGVDDWRTKDVWFCSAKLLSVLGMAIQQAHTPKKVALLLSILMQCLQPFLELVETWLKLGTLHDLHGDFIISWVTGQSEADNQNNLVLQGEYKSHPFISALNKIGVKPLPLLVCLAEHAEVAGRSIQLLQGLHSMNSVPHPENKETLYHELLNAIKARLLPDIDTEELGMEQKNDTSLAGPAGPSESVRSELDQYVRDFVISNNDSYMLKAFGDILELGLGVTHPEEQFSFPHELLLFRQVTSVQCINPVLTDSLNQILEQRVEGLGLRAQQLLHQRCRLADHLAAVRAVALLEGGISMHQFFMHLLLQSDAQEDWSSWATWYLLTNQLQACLSDHHLDFSHLFSVTVNLNTSVTKTSEITEGFPIMQLINKLEIQYKMDWPIPLILSNTNMAYYNDMFRFLGKVKCSLLSLQRLRWQDMHSSYSSSLVRRMSVLRSWLLFLLGSIQEHLLGHILTTLTDKLSKELTSAKDLQTVLLAHDEFVQRAFAYCLLNSPALPAHNIIMQVVALAMSVCDGWRRGDLTFLQLAALESDYSKVHNFLAALFGQLTRFGSNPHLSGVAAALEYSTPQY